MTGDIDLTSSPTSSPPLDEKTALWREQLLRRLDELGKLQLTAPTLEDFCAGIHQILQSCLPADWFMAVVINLDEERVSFVYRNRLAAQAFTLQDQELEGQEPQAQAPADTAPAELDLIFGKTIGDPLTKDQWVSFITESASKKSDPSDWVWMAEPLLTTQGQWTGVILAATNRLSMSYTTAQQELFRFIASQIGLAVRHFQIQAAMQQHLVDHSERGRSAAELEAVHARLAHLSEHIERTFRQLLTINEMGEILQGCQAMDEAFAVAADYAPRIFSHQAGALFMLDSSGAEVTAVAAWGAPQTRLQFKQEECWALRRARVHHVNETNSRLRCVHIIYDKNIIEASAYACIPLLAQGQMIGTLFLQAAPQEQNLSSEGISPLPLDVWRRLGSVLAERLALSAANILLRETIRQQSVRDPLTGLYNLGYMKETLHREILRADRHKYSVGVIMLDIDDFTRFNQRYGHDVGDLLLRELGRYLMSSVRGDDVVCRYGGEKFMVLMPGATLEDSLRRAEELRIGASGISLGEVFCASVEGENPADSPEDHLNSAPSYSSILSRYASEGATSLVGGARCTSVEPIFLSLGVAAYPKNGTNGDEVLHAADHALSQAKAKGRNRVIAANTDKSKKQGAGTE